MNKLLIGGILLLASCRQAEEKKPLADTTSAHKKADIVRPVADNVVKAEAPDAEAGMEQGYCLSRHDNGNAQSPVNIISSEVQPEPGKSVDIHLHTHIVAAENLGHTVQVDFQNGSTLEAAGKTYFSKQFHFHTPSEHLIDGMTFPMEMHIVNQLRDSSGNAQSSFLVIAVLFKMGKENKLIGEFLKSIPKEEGKKESLPNDAANILDLSPQVLHDGGKDPYYAYDGSLTTAPFTEKVRWIVLKRIVEASPEQIATIVKLEGNNARHIQALFDRRVAVSKYQ